MKGEELLKKLGFNRKEVIKSLHNKEIIVVCGGPGTEREVSRRSAKMITSAIEGIGLNVNQMEFEEAFKFLQTVKNKNSVIVFNAMHGRPFGEDGKLAAALDIMQISYTHSGHLTSAFGIDKHHTHLIMKEAGVPYPKYAIISKKDLISGHFHTVATNMNLEEYVIKPVNDGSSVDTFVKTVKDQTPNFSKVEFLSNSEEFMLQEYVEGREVSVAVIRSKGIGVSEMIVAEGFYDYHNKYLSTKTQHITPAEIDSKIEEKLLYYSELLHNHMKCRTISRTDFRIDKSGKIYALEINTHPGMTNVSILPDIARTKGISYENVILMLLQDARFEV